jgi:hypothetical protein
MATKFERAMTLLADAEQDAQQATARDIVSDLKDYLRQHATAEQVAGMKEAIEFIQANYVIPR